MHRYLLTLIFTLLTTILLTGCGGGGGGGSDSSSTSSDSSSSDTTDDSTSPSTSSTSTSSSVTINALKNSNATGIIIDASGVEGLRVVCGSSEMITKVNGAFECDNFPMSVFIGEFKIGEVKELPATKIVYTQDLLGVALGATTHPDVTKISMILQSLDSDASPLTNITISQESIALLNSHLGYDSAITDKSLEDVEYIIEDVLRTLKEQDETAQHEAVDSITAQNNLTTMTASAPALTYEQRSMGRI